MFNNEGTFSCDCPQRPSAASQGAADPVAAIEA